MIGVSEDVWDVWESGQFVGEHRPMTRVIISKHVLSREPGSDARSLLFLPGGANPDAPETPTIPSIADSYELPNIRLVEIDRRLGSEAASVRITMRNNLPPEGTDNLDLTYEGTPGTEDPNNNPSRRTLKDLGRPGHFTYRRGVAVDTEGRNPWSHDSSAWVDLLIPNRVMKTFQGYGTDLSANPASDANLYLTGIWLIDRVEYKSNGDIIIEGRDMAKLLIEQHIYPPLIPLNHYPLEMCADRFVTDTRTVTEPVAPQHGANVAKHPGPGSFTYTVQEGDTLWKLARRFNVIASDNSWGYEGQVHWGDIYHANQGIIGPDPDLILPGQELIIPGGTEGGGFDSSVAHVRGYNATVFGARASNAFDGSDATWWMSLGYTTPNGYEWIAADTGGELINRVRFKQRWGGYKVYVSVKVGDKWQGSQNIPAPQSHARIPYVHEVNTEFNYSWVTIDLDDSYEADEVRLTFTSLRETDLQERGISDEPYRASIYEFQVHQYTPPSSREAEEDFQNLIEGNIQDYTSIVKILAAYAGFYWPHSNPDPDLTRFDEALQGRVWGDFFQSGAYPVDPPCIPKAFFDQKSVMDAINQVKEILGFIFMVDTTGGIQWRPPNIWRTGNYVLGQGYQGESSVRTVSEQNVLLDYGTTVTDENLRSDIVVVSADDPSVYGSFQPGWAEGESAPGTQLTDLALLAGQERTMLVANYPFGTADDPNAQAAIEKFAFLVSLWIHWSYRRSRFRIPGNPAFEVDDQVRIYERVTSETYVHYIEGYTSTMDMEAGTWFMDMDTHWLGNGPSQQWVIRSRDMHPALFAYLQSIGQLPDEVTDDVANYPDDWWVYTPPTPPDTDVRVEDDYAHLFPLPPDLEWPSGDYSTEVPDSTGGWVVPPDAVTGGGTSINCSNSAMFSHWGSNCGGAPKTRVLFAAPAGSGSSKAHANQSSYIYLSVHTHARPAFEALAQIIVSEAYQLKSGQCGSYNCRKIAGSSSWSNHSWATAVDLNYTDLPYGRKAPAGHPVWRVAQRALGLRTGNGKPIFRWGGNWSGSNADPMHFEVCCTPADLRTGVVGSGGVGNPGGTGDGGAYPV